MILALKSHKSVTTVEDNIIIYDGGGVDCVYFLFLLYIYIAWFC